MATKEEHLAEMREDRFEREKIDLQAMLWRIEERCAEALAERDAAREELANLKAAQPVAEPAAPEQEGPFRSSWFAGKNCDIIDANGLVFANVANASRLEEAIRLLNLGVEAEKLRARVAELEGELDQAREHRDAYGRDREALKARADAAEAKLAAHDKALDNAWTELESVHPVGIIGCADIDAAVKVICDELKKQDAQVKNLKAKLAGLGENPIPRALVVRHRNHCTANQWLFTADAIDEILAGREPGVAQ